MVGYFEYDGLIYQYPLPDRKTGFLIQSKLKENFNTTPLIANASYFKKAPIWGHTELHITRLWTQYVATDAATLIYQYINTGNEPIRFLSVPVGYCPATVAGEIALIDSGEIDIAVHPSGDTNTTSWLQFILLSITGYNATDDCQINFQGWYRDSTPFTKPEPSEVIIAGIRGDIGPVTFKRNK